MTAKSKVLREVFGFDGFRGRTGEIVDHLIDGRHVLAVTTGSGKSICYQVPALVKQGFRLWFRPGGADARPGGGTQLAGVAAETINWRLRARTMLRFAGGWSGLVRILYGSSADDGAMIAAGRSWMKVDRG
jgi:ATP-dependent DNA helicase RecQ